MFDYIALDLAEANTFHRRLEILEDEGVKFSLSEQAQTYLMKSEPKFNTLTTAQLQDCFGVEAERKEEEKKKIPSAAKVNSVKSDERIYVKYGQSTASIGITEATTMSGLPPLWPSSSAIDDDDDLEDPHPQLVDSSSDDEKPIVKVRTRTKRMRGAKRKVKFMPDCKLPDCCKPRWNGTTVCEKGTHLDHRHQQLEKLIPESGWDEFIKCYEEARTEENGKDISVSEIIDKIRLDCAKQARRDEIATQTMSADSDTQPSGSIRSWLAGTDDDSRRRKNNDEHTKGYSSESKTPDSAQDAGTVESTNNAVALQSDNANVRRAHCISTMGGISAFGNGTSEWIEIEITIDSGACETVMPMSWCKGISVLSSPQYLQGVEYEVANGETIPNLGERRCLMMTAGSNAMKKITFQVADVHKPLLAISKIADQGFECILGKTGGRLIDQVTGEIIPLVRRDNLYVMKAWVRQDMADITNPQLPAESATPFAGPAR